MTTFLSFWTKNGSCHYNTCHYGQLFHLLGNVAKSLCLLHLHILISVVLIWQIYIMTSSFGEHYQVDLGDFHLKFLKIFPLYSFLRLCCFATVRLFWAKWLTAIWLKITEFEGYHSLWAFAIHVQWLWFLITNSTVIPHFKITQYFASYGSICILFYWKQDFGDRCADEVLKLLQLHCTAFPEVHMEFQNCCSFTLQLCCSSWAPEEVIYFMCTNQHTIISLWY